MTLLKDLLASDIKGDAKSLNLQLEDTRQRLAQLQDHAPHWQARLDTIASDHAQCQQAAVEQEAALRAVLAKGDMEAAQRGAELLANLENQLLLIASRRQAVEEEQRLYRQLERQLVDLRRQLSLVSAARELARMQHTLDPLLKRQGTSTKAALKAIRQREARTDAEAKVPAPSSAATVLARLKGLPDE
ncbi:hypothetical protein [Gallaecimonas pentaromativorans]|uniref:hypothetical protein n=1 Tax=Gallaecimonas pentaromativorans TaxID=584787 RepID=UPI003A906DA5